MNSRRKRRFRRLVTVIISCTAMMPGMARLAVASDFKPPDMDGFSLHDERDTDGDGDGVNDTHIMHYLSLSGDSIVSMTTQGRIWAWSLETRGEDSGTKNYVIRDSNCDGMFDEVYSLDDKFYVPDCLK
jgi:hypothetical protein